MNLVTGLCPDCEEGNHEVPPDIETMFPNLEDLLASHKSRVARLEKMRQTGNYNPENWEHDLAKYIELHHGIIKQFEQVLRDRTTFEHGKIIWLRETEKHWIILDVSGNSELTCFRGIQNIAKPLEPSNYTKNMPLDITKNWMICHESTFYSSDDIESMLK